MTETGGERLKSPAGAGKRPTVPEVAGKRPTVPEVAGKRPTMADVAAHAGVSTALVSIVIREVPGASPATRERVLAAATELGYRPDNRARMLRSSSSRLLGVVFGVQHAFHGDLITGLYDAAAAAGYQLALSAVTAHRHEAEAIDDLLEDRCAAIILLGPETPRLELAVIAERLPVVAVARPVRNQKIDVIRTADDRGMHLAVDHLVALGHQRIAHIDGGRAPGAGERRRGYREAMVRHGWGDQIQIVPAGPTEDDGAAAARSLLNGFVVADVGERRRTGSRTTAHGSPAATSWRGLPTALAVFNDRCATGVLDVVRAVGLRVPEDISVIGYDDSSLARLSFRNLTTIAQDAAQMAVLAVERAIARAQGAPVSAREQIVPPRLVIRKTTAAVREA